MNTREKFSIVLIVLGIIIALLPITANPSFLLRPHELLAEIIGDQNSVTVDQVAKLIVSEDSTMQIIDLRSPKEYMEASLPGSVNIPYPDFINSIKMGIPGDKNTKTILYSNGSYDSNSALVIAKGMKNTNIYVMEGGLNEWYKTIMNSRFSGGRITARENALFETRSRAGRLFTDLNSLPDSLKIKYIESKKLAAQTLDGGCE